MLCSRHRSLYANLGCVMTEPPRWEYDLLTRPFVPRRNPLPIPTPDIFDTPLGCVRVNRTWISHLLGVLEALTQPDAWLGTDEEIYSAQQQIEQLIAALNQGCSMDIGTIIPSIRDEVPDNYLFCDGAEYERADYPELVAVIGLEFLTEDDKFIVPDLRGRTLVGAGEGPGLTIRQSNHMDGAETHLLSYYEMPPHGHPAISSYGLLANISTASPNRWIADIPFNTDTGLTPPDGAQVAMPMMPPFTALKYYLVAR